MADMKDVTKTLVVTLISSGLGASVGSYYTTKYQTDVKAHSAILKRVIDDDLNISKRDVSILRLVKELGSVNPNAVQGDWDRFVAEHPDKLPRFYLSGFIWSRFHSEVRNIKTAYKQLGLLAGDVDDKADSAFALATMRFQIEHGRADPESRTKSLTVDGVVGKGTLARLVETMQQKNMPSPW